MQVAMWEVRVEPEQEAGFICWLNEQALTHLDAAPGLIGHEVFRDKEGHWVVLSRWDGPVTKLPIPPATLIARPAHDWEFSPYQSH